MAGVRLLLGVDDGVSLQIGFASERKKNKFLSPCNFPELVKLLM
jgi:hypothetical protein